VERWPGAAGQAGRIVTIADEALGAHYFVVETTLELTRLVDTELMRPEIDSATGRRRHHR
jgi:hypothetical protein